jgi:hypothetical protein
MLSSGQRVTFVVANGQEGPQALELKAYEGTGAGAAARVRLGLLRGPSQRPLPAVGGGCPTDDRAHPAGSTLRVVPATIATVMRELC